MRTSLLLLSLAALAGAPRAQSVYGMTGPNCLVVEMTGPSVGGCSYPDGPVASLFPYAQAAVCGAFPAPVAFVPGMGIGPFAGDIAVNRENGRVFVTDGLSIGVYNSTTGLLLGNFDAAAIGVAAPLTGLGWDGTNGWLWVSNAFGYGALEPDGTCTPIAQLAFQASPLAAGFITDIDVDPATAEVWVCTNLGTVAHFVAGAAAPTNVMPVAGALPCGFVGVPLLGLCIDTSSPPGTFVVTDGVTVARLSETGAATFGGPPMRFALPQACWPAPGGAPLLGLGWSGKPVSYGAGTGPVLEAIGHATVPSPGFALELSGAPAGLAAILYDLGVSCPAVPVGGAPGYLGFTPLFGMIGPFAIGGNLMLPAALPGPAILPQGVTVHLQALVDGAGGGALDSSNALAFTTSLP
jgi:hypothetical protein